MLRLVKNEEDEVKRVHTPEEEEQLKKEMIVECEQRNSENEARLKQERLKANQNVIRSYRLKR